MTHLMPGVGVSISREKPRPCSVCGKVRELRPYGPNGEDICWDCGQKDPETTERKLHERMGKWVDSLSKSVGAVG